MYTTPPAETPEKLEIAPGPFDSSWESLRTFECPDWFRDGKLAFWSHWGPQAVPMFGDWYARHMYVEGTDQYRHHWRVYGHPSKHGYKDLVPLWKAEKFDPDALMDLFVKAGAKYFFGQAMHHDNFDNFDSAHNPWNSVKVGPKKDIVQLWKDAAKKRGLPFGLSEHHGASFNWFETSKHSDSTGPYAGVPYDGNDPEYASLYHKNTGYPMIHDDGSWHMYTDNPEFPRNWFDRVKDVIDKYQPDLLYSDGGVPYHEYGRSIVAHLYNTSAANNGGVNKAVYQQKDTTPEIFTIGVLDIERGMLNQIAEHPWQNDTSVGDWFYNVKDVYKTVHHILETFVDVVSQNGNLLLNITQKPDGTIDEECENILLGMGKWNDINGEGIFGSRPWIMSFEGPTIAETGHFKEDAAPWTSEDFRFTRNGDTVYAFQMRWPENKTTTIRALAAGANGTVQSVRLLGHGEVPFQQTEQGLVITVPEVTLPEGPVGYGIALG